MLDYHEILDNDTEGQPGPKLQLSRHGAASVVKGFAQRSLAGIRTRKVKANMGPAPFPITPRRESLFCLFQQEGVVSRKNYFATTSDEMILSAYITSHLLCC